MTDPNTNTLMSIHAMYHYYVSSPTGIIPPWRTLLNLKWVGGLEVVAKLVMAIESRQIDSGFGIGQGRSINGWEEIVDSNTLRCMTVISGWMLKDGQKKELKE